MGNRMACADCERLRIEREHLQRICERMRRSLVEASGAHYMALQTLGEKAKIDLDAIDAEIAQHQGRHFIPNSAAPCRFHLPVFDFSTPIIESLGRRRSLAVFLAVLVFSSLYLLPVLAEYALLQVGISSFLCCVVLSDLPGALTLYAMGFRRSAVGIYVIATVVETILMLDGVMPNRLIWVTNVGPALATAGLGFVRSDFNPA